MMAHNSGQLLNSSKLGESLGVSHTTLRSYLDILQQTFMIRLLPPLEINIKKRLIKSPKVYIRDSGILHGLLQIDSFNDLLGHPILGSSWEGFIIEQIINNFSDMIPSFYRTASRAEMDLVLVRGNRRIAIECKSSSAPKPTKGFWNACDDIDPQESWIIAPIDDIYEIKKDVRIAGIKQFLNHYNK